MQSDISNLLTRGVEGIIEKNHLEVLLSSGKKLRVKFGIDPTGTKIHIGRAVPLWKLREFQDAGHQIVLIIGDFTAQIGDASDKLAKRPFLTLEQVQENMKGYLAQVGRILDIEKCEVHYNSTWLAKLTFREICDLAEVFSVAQMIERRNFRERWDKKEEISVREFLYPLMQGYDSVAVKADVEIGGTDQLFNLTAGRRIQEFYGQPVQDVITTAMLNGLDGRKMSTSWGNVINIDDAPQEQFGKVMSMHDNELISYFTLATSVSLATIAEYEKELADGRNPKEIKEILATEIVARYHPREAALAAKQHFESLFSKKQMPEDLPELRVSSSATVLELVIASGVSPSNAQARRLVEQGAVEVDGVACTDIHQALSLHGGEVAKIGKKQFFKLVVS